MSCRHDWPPGSRVVTSGVSMVVLGLGGAHLRQRRYRPWGVLRPVDVGPASGRLAARPVPRPEDRRFLRRCSGCYPRRDSLVHDAGARHRSLSACLVPRAARLLWPGRNETGGSPGPHRGKERARPTHQTPVEEAVWVGRRRGLRGAPDGSTNMMRHARPRYAGARRHLRCRGGGRKATSTRAGLAIVDRTARLVRRGTDSPGPAAGQEPHAYLHGATCGVGPARLGRCGDRLA